MGMGGQGKQGVSWKLHGETVTQSLAASDPLSPAVCSPSSGQEVFPTISCTERMGHSCCQWGPIRFLLLCVMEPPLVLWLVLWPVTPRGSEQLGVRILPEDCSLLMFCV